MGMFLEQRKCASVLPLSDKEKVLYFLLAPLIPGRFPVVEIIKVFSGLRLRIDVVFPLPDSPTIEINSAIMCLFSSFHTIDLFLFIIKIVIEE